MKLTMLSTHQKQTQNISYNVHMAVIYHTRPGMEFVTKTQTSKISSSSKVVALKAASNSGEFTADQLQERKEQYSSDARKRQSANVLLYSIYPPNHMRDRDPSNLNSYSLPIGLE